MNCRWLMLVCTLFVGCAQGPIVDVEYEPPPPTDTNFDRLPEVLTGISSAGEILLYEGLPSEFWEPQLRERELAQKETIKLHGYSVYEEPQEFSGADAGRVTKLLSANDSFARYRSGKSCGGFQPEFAIEWKTGEAVTKVLICLDCGEVKLFGPKAELHCDLSPQVVKQLKDVLSPYRKNSPETDPP